MKVYVCPPVPHLVVRRELPLALGSVFAITSKIHPVVANKRTLAAYGVILLGNRGVEAGRKYGSLKAGRVLPLPSIPLGR